MKFLGTFWILVLFLCCNTISAQNNIKRDPDTRKDHANVFYKPSYTLFDLWSDEPIFPDKNGIYNIYYATNENKKPASYSGTAEQISKLTAYKFKDLNNCSNWCKGLTYNSSNKSNTPETTSTQTNPENCEEARKKYLEQNPDVAKARMDAWNHYQSFGKKEGRKWPNCEVQNSSPTPSPASASPKASTPAQPARIYTHDCIYENQQPISDSKAFSADEDIVDKYEKITKKYPVIFNEVNGSRVCSVFYFSLADRVVHRGDFTENQLSTLKAYKFQRLEDCLQLFQMVQEADLRIQDTSLTENEIHVRSNVTGIEIRTIEESIFLGKSQTNDFFYSFEKLKNKYLTISLKHPLCKDTVVEIDKNTHFAYVRMTYTSNFLYDEFKLLKSQSNLQSMRSLQAITVDEKLYREIASYADSIEIDASRIQGTGIEIENFLVARPYSSRYQDALKVQQYYEDAEAAYTSAKSANTIKEYEYFLKTFNLSNHKDEVTQLLVVEACRYYSINVGGADSLLNCYTKYIVPYKTEPWIQKHELNLKSRINLSLSQEFVRILSNKNSNPIDDFGYCLRRLKSMEKNLDGYSFETASGVILENQGVLFTYYFDQLKKLNTTKSQDSLIDHFLSNFAPIIQYNGPKQVNSETCIRYIFNYGQKNGHVALRNSDYLFGYLKDYLPNFSKEYSYNGKTFRMNAAESVSKMEWLNNELKTADAVTQGDNGVAFGLKFSKQNNFGVLSYYQNAKLVVEKYYTIENFSMPVLTHTYEFENDVNISLKALENLVSSAEKAINEHNLGEAEMLLNKARNTFPSTLPENKHLAETLSKYNTALEKHNAEVKKKEEEDRKKREASFNFVGMEFELYEVHTVFATGSTRITIISNTEAEYIVNTIMYDNTKFRDVCRCKCTISGSEIKLFGYFDDRDTFPDPINETFVYDKSKEILTSKTYMYTDYPKGSAPTSDLAGRYQIWHKK